MNPPEPEEEHLSPAAQELLAHRPNDLGYRYFTPLEAAADEYIQWAQNPQERIYTGIDVFDDAMRGTAPGEMTLVVGFAHSGKTVLVSTLIANNAHNRIAFFTPDETRVLVLVKLTSLVHGIDAEELERRIAEDDAAAKRLVRETAAIHFPNLAVFEESMDIRTMDRALDEAEDYWGGKCQAVIFDYLELLEDGDDGKTLAKVLKAWGKKRRVPLFVLHQSSRTAGKDGQAVTISSGAFGGEQQATHLIGVRRRKNELVAIIKELEEKIASQADPKPHLFEKLAEAQYDLRVHAHTVTFNLVKNKRPPCALVDDTDFVLDKRTGRITPLVDGAGAGYVERSQSQAAPQRASIAQAMRRAQGIPEGQEEMF